MEMMLDKKNIQVTLLFEFKMGHKAVESTCNINTFGPRTANEHSVQWWFKKFYKGDESLEDEHSGHHQKLTTTNWEPSSKLILLQLHEKLPKNLTSTILLSLGMRACVPSHLSHVLLFVTLRTVAFQGPLLIWSKMERWKSLISGCLMNWSWMKKINSRFKVSSYSMQQWTISQSPCDMWQKAGFIQQLAMTSSVAGQKNKQKYSKALPKVKLAPKKGQGHCLVVFCLSNPLQLSES